MDIARPGKGKIEEWIETGDGTFVRWAPGDGLAYRALFMRVPQVMERAIGCSENTIFVSIERHDKGWASYPLHCGSHHVEWYVSEKFVCASLGSGFSVAITALINMMVGDAAYGEEQYEKIVR